MEIFEGSGFIPTNKEKLLQQCAGLEIQGVAPFSDVALAVLGSLSKRLMRAPQAKIAPQLTALGFWLRPAMLNRMKLIFLPAVRTTVCQPLAVSLLIYLRKMSITCLFIPRHFRCWQEMPMSCICPAKCLN